MTGERQAQPTESLVEFSDLSFVCLSVLLHIVNATPLRSLVPIACIFDRMIGHAGKIRTVALKAKERI